MSVSVPKASAFMLLIILVITCTSGHWVQGKAINDHPEWHVVREAVSDLNGDSIPETLILRATGFYESHGLLVMDGDWQTYELLFVQDDVEHVIYRKEGHGYMDMFIGTVRGDQQPRILVFFDNWDLLEVHVFTPSPGLEFTVEELIHFDKVNRDLLIDYRNVWQGYRPNYPDDDDPGWITIREVVTSELHDDSIQETIILFRGLGFYELEGRLAMVEDWQTYELAIVYDGVEQVAYENGTFGFMDMFVGSATDDVSPTILLLFDRWEWLEMYEITYSTEFGVTTEELILFDKDRATWGELLAYRWFWQGVPPMRPGT